MAVYKVPQDVEAEDKLLGPFSFRQFIYLGIVAMAIVAGWGLSLIFIGLAIIPLPIVLLFGALALPLRKDQPMETYLAAMVQFFLKPHNRMWKPDGIVSRISIDMPLVIEQTLTKSISEDQALNQFNYLAEVADTGGWSARGVHQPLPVVENPGEDMLDSSSSVAQSFDGMLQKEDTQRMDQLLARIHSGAIVEEAPVVTPHLTPPQPQVPALSSSEEYTGPPPVFNPYPTDIHQHVIEPAGEKPAHHKSQTHHKTPKAAPPAPAPSVDQPSPAIIKLATESSDLKVSTLASMGHHVEEVENHGDEVIINLH